MKVDIKIEAIKDTKDRKTILEQLKKERDSFTP